MSGGEELKVREHPKSGPYVAGLTALTATSYSEIERCVCESECVCLYVSGGSCKRRGFIRFFSGGGGPPPPFVFSSCSLYSWFEEWERLYEFTATHTATHCNTHCVTLHESLCYMCRVCRYYETQVYSISICHLCCISTVWDRCTLREKEREREISMCIYRYKISLYVYI